MSFVYMRVLESAPLRYDRGLRLLSGGRIDRVYVRLAEIAAAPGRTVLDVGCGTGGASLACAARGADVVGIDRDPGMLEVARAKPTAGLPGHLEWIELGAAELEDRFAPASFDAAVACLSFSEMAPQERSYVLERVHRLLRPGGRFALADEIEPETTFGRVVYRLRRWPFAAAALLVTQTTTRPLPDPTGLFQAAGFAEVVREETPVRTLRIHWAAKGAGRP